MLKRTATLWATLTLLFISATLTAAPVDKGDGWGPTQAPNVDSVRWTRHNLTVEYATYNGFMNPYRNNYSEVCVYCHTPHAANTNTQGTPLWNRTTPDSTYQLYNLPTMTEQTISQPGPSSITCLSCHDGTIGIDSIINMPGSGNYEAGQANAQNDVFLDSWNDNDHSTMDGCTWCHYEGNGWAIPAFEAYLIGTDLRDDHPVGVTYPDTSVYHDSFNDPAGIKGDIKFFDNDGDSSPDKDEIRVYNSGGGYEVECASCHDPHGVMSGEGATFNASFLRIDNNESAVCMTCHIK